ncbi:MAG: tol-pal system protein YbgF [Gallionellaceae bacterium]|jgi:tol-pal system protein YbgF|nr:tol-pal system protein YbgF [Gallionellaceae bacterium]
MKLRALLFFATSLVVAPAHAGLFDDEEARKQIQQTSARITTLEESSAQQTNTQLNLQSQIEALGAQLRNLQGQNEELAHGLQGAEKRQQDFYLDLDTRLRRFEPSDAPVAAVAPEGTAATTETADDLITENRTFEVAHGLFQAGKHQEAVAALQNFLGKYPDSVYAPNAHYELGTALFALEDYENALAAYRVVTKKYAYSPKMPDAMLGVASCQRSLKAVKSANETLKQLVSKYPNSDAAKEAKQRLSASQ